MKVIRNRIRADVSRLAICFASRHFHEVGEDESALGRSTLEAASERAGLWLLESQMAGRNFEPNGYSRHFSLITRRWASAYPETTGYIIPSLYLLACDQNDQRFADSADAAATWLVSIQAPNGSFTDPSFSGSQVFDTAQAIAGLLAAHRQTGEERYLDAAMSAGRWLISVQESDGSWINNTFCSAARAYYIKAGCVLFDLSDACCDPDFGHAAQKNLHWTLQKQTTDGWFDGAYFRDSSLTLGHLICYVLEGLLHCAVHSDSNLAQDAAVRLANNLLRLTESRDGFVPGFIYHRDSTGSDWLCNVATAQWLYCGLKLCRLTKNFDHSSRFVTFLRSFLAKQLVSAKPEIRGNFLASQPAHSSYLGARLVNWLPKYVIDAVAQAQHIEQEDRRTTER